MDYELLSFIEADGGRGDRGTLAARTQPTFTREPASLPVDDDPDRTRRDRIHAAGLDSGRIPNWTLLTDSELWAEWRKRFQGDADLAFDAALRLARRMAPQRCVEFQKQLHRIERALLGDTVSDTTYLEPVEHEEDSRLPLPFTGILAILKHLAWKRAGLHPWDAAP